MLENSYGDHFVYLDQLQSAIQVATYWRDVAIYIFGQYAVNEQARIENKILERLSEKPYQKRDLQRTFSVSAKQFNDALDALMKAERVLRLPNGMLNLI